MSRSYLSCLKNIPSYIPYDIASIIVPIINIDAPFFSSSSSSKKIRLFVTRGEFSSRKFIAIFRFLSPIISSISKIDYIIFQYPVNCVTGKLFLRFFQKKKNKTSVLQSGFSIDKSRMARYFWNSNQLKKMTKNYIRPIFINFWTWLEKFHATYSKKKKLKKLKKKRKKKLIQKASKNIGNAPPTNFFSYLFPSIPVEEKWADVWQLYSRLIATGTPAERSS